MTKLFAVVCLALAALPQAPGTSQDARERGSYKEMRDMLGELVQRKQYAAAAEMLERVVDRFPDHLAANTYNLATMRVLMGEYEKAMDALEKGLRGGVFYGRFAFEADVMEPLTRQPRFPALAARNLALLEEAQRRATMKLEVATPTGYDPAGSYPLFVALHGGGENIALFRPNWTSPRLRAEFIVAYVQSSQVADMTTFHWQDEATTRRDLEAAYNQVIASYAVDTNRVIVGGFSSGGFGALVTAFHRFLPVRGFVALCPEVPSSISDGEIAAATARGIRGSLLTTELDRRVQAQSALAERWKLAGLDGEFLVTPNVGHWYPSDFAGQLDRAIARILGPIPPQRRFRGDIEDR